MFETPLIPDVEFSDNANQRTPCVLVLDCSTSMIGDPVDRLNDGLATFENHLKNDPVAALRVQVLTICVGRNDNVDVLHNWVDAIDFKAPFVEANGTTPLGAGMDIALQLVEHQKAVYDSNGVSSTRPWILLISDGRPTDDHWQQVAAECRVAEQNNQVVIFPIGTESADLKALSLFSNRPAKRLRGLDFRELFVWLSRSMSAVSSSVPGDQIILPDANWETIDI